MKFPYSMLLEFVETKLSPTEAGELLTMAGFELEGIESVGGEYVLDVKVMSNRGDGLSMLGLAREVLAKDPNAKPTLLYMRSAAYYVGLPTTPSTFPVSISIEAESCTRYAGRVFREVSNGESPAWLKDRLLLMGHRSVSNIVDLTNYVMIELGQPLHAFDLDKIEGPEIIVRNAIPGESLVTLDGNLHELSADQTMICDASKPIAVAGIMGGASTEVSVSTRNILLESAHFDAVSVRKTRKQLELNTEASYRFERSVDPNGVVRAIERFTELLGEPGTQIEDIFPGKKASSTISVRIDRARTLLGMDIREEQAKTYFERLGMEVGGHGDPFFVVPPSWRPDIQREEDLIEELGRVHGYDKIPETLPSGATTSASISGRYQQIDTIREGLLRRGYTQVINHSLRGAHPLDAEGERLGPRTIASPEYALLRNSLIPSLSDTFQKNGARNLHLFELGKIFRRAEGDFRESLSLAMISAGNLVPSYLKGESIPQASFFSLKGDVESLLCDVGRIPYFEPSRCLDARLHPTRRAAIVVQGRSIGLIGQIHPTLGEELRLDLEACLLEVDLDQILLCDTPEMKLRPLSRNPSVKRDIAILIDKTVPYKKIDEVIKFSAAETLEKLTLFDDFEGEGIPQGMHSLGITLQLRKLGENFTDQEANQVRDAVVEALAELGGSAR
jgi:phenylalanyl-tRNA synthetase beta chain